MRRSLVLLTIILIISGMPCPIPAEASERCEVGGVLFQFPDGWHAIGKSEKGELLYTKLSDTGESSGVMAKLYEPNVKKLTDDYLVKHSSVVWHTVIDQLYDECELLGEIEVYSFNDAIGVDAFACIQEADGEESEYADVIFINNPDESRGAILVLCVADWDTISEDEYDDIGYIYKAICLSANYDESQEMNYDSYDLAEDDDSYYSSDSEGDDFDYEIDHNLVGRWYTLNSLIEGAASLFLPYGDIMSGVLGVYRASESYPNTLVLYSDGSGYADDYYISWSVSGSYIIFEYSDGSKKSFYYSVDSDELVLDTLSVYRKS